MTMKEKVKIILAGLDEHYLNETICHLDHQSPIQLLIATILSAQCTDARVNIITKDLFDKYVTVEDFACADIIELEHFIFSAGFYHAKGKNIISACNKIVNQYNSIVPSEIEDLTSLAGVGRKTANVIRGHIFNLPAVIVDTHVSRISQRLGLTKNTDPVKIEFDLMKILPKSHWTKYNTQIITHGRNVCKSQRPKCDICCFCKVCCFINNKSRKDNSSLNLTK